MVHWLAWCGSATTSRGVTEPGYVGLSGDEAVGLAAEQGVHDVRVIDADDPSVMITVDLRPGG